MRIQRAAFALFLAFALLFAQACSLHPVPQAPGEAIALAANDLDGVVQAAIAATNAGLIDEELHAKLLNGFKEVRGFLAAAALIHETGEEGVWMWVDLATDLILELSEEVPQ